jgi:hypothetical protein
MVLLVGCGFTRPTINIRELLNIIILKIPDQLISKAIGVFFMTQLEIGRVLMTKLKTFIINGRFIALYRGIIDILAFI